METIAHKGVGCAFFLLCTHISGPSLSSNLIFPWVLDRKLYHTIHHAKDGSRAPIPLGLGELAESDCGEGEGAGQSGGDGRPERRAMMVAEPGAMRVVARGSGGATVVPSDGLAPTAPRDELWFEVF
jgi:hypothetical protein